MEVNEWVIRPYPLSETFFAERLRGCDHACSVEVYGRLRDAAIIDERGFSKWHKCENCWCAAACPPCLTSLLHTPAQPHLCMTVTPSRASVPRAK